MKKLMVVGIIILLVGVSVPSTGINVEKSNTSYDGKTLYVGGDGPGNYSKIQAAIDNASGGDTVFVYNGEYHENVIVNKAISLIGMDKNQTKILGVNGDVVDIIHNNVLIHGFTISHEPDKRAISCIIINSNNNIIRDNLIFDAYYGIRINGYNNKILTNKIKDCFILIALSHSCLNNISENIFLDSCQGIIYLAEYCDHNYISRNYINCNGFIGIRGAHYNVFELNDIIHCRLISLSSSYLAFNFYNISYGNVFKKNNLHGCEEFLLKYYSYYPHSLFIFNVLTFNGRLTKFNRNYYSKFQGIRPKRILGFLEFEFIINDFTSYSIKIPYLHIDRNPKRKPYDIPVINAQSIERNCIEGFDGYVK